MIHEELALKIAKEQEKLRFSMGWNFDQSSKYLMEKYEIDLADLDEILQVAEKIESRGRN
jgi:hypothetical protein